MKVLIKEFLLDLIFPKYCFGCGALNHWVCPECQKDIVYVQTQVCPECERISVSGKFCPKCRKPNGLRGIVAACYLEEGPIRELIHNFKYNSVYEIGQFLAQMMSRALKESIPLKGDILIVPVPLHWLRQSQRGYNQSEILAREIAKILVLPSHNILKKSQRTKRQVDLKGSLRRKNLSKVFKLKSNINLKGLTIILVDDVTTTGTTLNECAKILRRAGAQRVWAIVVARA